MPEKSDGQTFSGAEHNLLPIHRKKFADATERTSTNTNFEDSGTEFTLTALSGALILGFVLKCEAKNSGATSNTQIGLEISGTNLGSKFIIREEFAVNVTTRYGMIVSDTEDVALIVDSDSSGQNTFAAVGISNFLPIGLLDVSTTLTVRMRVSADTGTLKNVTIDVIYADGFIED